MKELYKRLSFLLIANFIFLYCNAQVKKVETIGITVSDMNRSIEFYNKVLGFNKISDDEFKGESYEQLQGFFGLNMRVVKMQLGEEIIELTDYLTSGGRGVPSDAKPNDLSFQHIAIVVSDMEKAYAQLRKFNIEHVSTSPQTLPASIAPAAGIKAFYFHDPDKHNLELIYFPKGKGLVKWQHTNGKVFLGIDHTAIGISNTEKSLELYQSILGIERKGESFNFGNEQAHLNNVEGASLHITGLRSAAGPGIEFLQYLQPGPGKPYPADSRTDDIWHWQTTLIVSNIESLFVTIKANHYIILSKGLIRLNSKTGMQKAFILRDPDGHALLIKEYL